MVAPDLYGRHTKIRPVISPLCRRQGTLGNTVRKAGLIRVFILPHQHLKRYASDLVNKVGAQKRRVPPISYIDLMTRKRLPRSSTCLCDETGRTDYDLQSILRKTETVPSQKSLFLYSYILRLVRKIAETALEEHATTKVFHEAGFRIRIRIRFLPR